MSDRLKEAKLAIFYDGDPFIPAEDLEDHLSPGDLIEIGSAVTHNHWAMYKRRGEVIDILPSEKDPSVATIEIRTLDESIGEENGARKHNKEKEAKERGFVARSAEEAIEAAMKDLKRKTVRYDLMESNCEHYCTKWRFGHEWSQQVDNLGKLKDVARPLADKILKDALLTDAEKAVAN